MARRKKKHRIQGEVELNLAAMLDMAFQLLTFFILTFKPAPVEGDVVLHLPPPMPTTMLKNAQSLGSDEKNKNPVQGLTTLKITVVGNDAGAIQTLAVGDSEVKGLEGLEARLKTVFGDEGTAFEQVLLQVGTKVHYEGLMQVIDVCTRQTQKGKKLSKLSFVELPGG